MYKTITIAYDESPEAGRALAAAIQLASVLGARIRALTIIEPLPAFMAYADVADSSVRLLIKQDREKTYERLHGKARQTARRQGVELETHLKEGDELDSMIRFLAGHPTDLLVLGLHHHRSHISRLWSTVYTLAEEAPCSVLGVH
jgi:nucleotide-binding universal stress UspA family protein